jgi:hypothetical protein
MRHLWKNSDLHLKQSRLYADMGGKLKYATQLLKLYLLASL